MHLRLMIADTRPEVLDAWRVAFQGFPMVTFASVDGYHFRRRTDLDAELMLGMFAHERFGGAPVHEQVQILNSHDSGGGPPWVVTPPPKLLPSAALASEQRGYPWEMSPEDLRRDYRRIFAAIKEFNASGPQPPIRQLGIHLEFVNAPVGDPAQEAEAAREAYVDVWGPVDRDPCA